MGPLPLVSSAPRLTLTVTAEPLGAFEPASVGSYVDAGTVVDMRLSIGPKAKTYSYNGSIAAPTAEEDPDYRDGIEVRIAITTSDGREIWGTTTSTRNRKDHKSLIDIRHRRTDQFIPSWQYFFDIAYPVFPVKEDDIHIIPHKERVRISRLRGRLNLYRSNDGAG